MQGDSLSPTLFSLFISDLPNEIDKATTPDIRIGNKDINILLYADDIVILADSVNKLQIKINVLFKYFEKNALTINLKKSKILIFQKGGLKSKKEKWWWDNIPIEIVNSYKYLGVLFSSSGLFLKNSNELIAKCLAAVKQIIGINNRVGLSSINHRFALFDSLVSSILQYASPIHALRYLNKFEKIQSAFIKKTLHLHPRSPGFALRLETGRRPLKIKIIENTLNYWVKCLKASNESLHKQSYMALLDSSTNPTNTNIDHNWCLQLKNIFDTTGYTYVWISHTPEIILKTIPKILQTLTDNTIQEDLSKATNLFHKQIYNVSNPTHLQEPYFHTPNIPFHLIRNFAQLRIHTDTLIINNTIYKLNTQEKCTICNTGEHETLEHVILKCPMYKGLRNKFLTNYNATNLNSLLSNPDQINNMFIFIQKVLLNRQIYLNIT